MKLYEFGPTRSIRVRWALQELGLPFESETVNLKLGEHRHPEFLKLNAAGKLPVLVDEGQVFTESVAIVLYLAETYGSGRLLPEDAGARGQVMRWMLFAATELEQPLWRIARNAMIYAPERRVPADIANAQQDFQDMAAVLEAHLQGRGFLVGDAFSAADIVTAYTLDWAREADLLQPFPALGQYLDRMYDRPAAPLHIAEAMAKLQPQQESNG